MPRYAERGRYLFRAKRIWSSIPLVPENLMGGPIPLSEYEAHEFDHLAERNIKDPRPEWIVAFTTP